MEIELEDVKEFLLDLSMTDDIIQKFVENNIIGVKFLQVTNDFLQNELGIKHYGKRKKIVEEIDKINKLGFNFKRNMINDDVPPPIDFVKKEKKEKKENQKEDVQKGKEEIQKVSINNDNDIPPLIDFVKKEQKKENQKEDNKMNSNDAPPPIMNFEKKVKKIEKEENQEDNKINTNDDIPPPIMNFEKKEKKIEKKENQKEDNKMNSNDVPPPIMNFEKKEKKIEKKEEKKIEKKVEDLDVGFGLKQSDYDKFSKKSKIYIEKYFKDSFGYFELLSKKNFTPNFEIDWKSILLDEKNVEKILDILACYNPSFISTFYEAVVYFGDKIFDGSLIFFQDNISNIKIVNKNCDFNIIKVEKEIVFEWNFTDYKFPCGMTLFLEKFSEILEIRNKFDKLMEKVIEEEEYSRILDLMSEKKNEKKNEVKEVKENIKNKKYLLFCSYCGKQVTTNEFNSEKDAENYETYKKMKTTKCMNGGCNEFYNVNGIDIVEKNTGKFGVFCKCGYKHSEASSSNFIFLKN
jgi:hypothetical protein